jgi:hypothetical protein
MQTALIWIVLIAWIALNPIIGIALGKLLKGHCHVPGR